MVDRLFRVSHIFINPLPPQVTQSILHRLSLGFLPLLLLPLCTLLRCLVLIPPVSKHTRSKCHSNIGTEKYQAREPFRKRVEYVKCSLGSRTIKCIRASRENRIPGRPMVHDRKPVYRNGGLERWLNGKYQNVAQRSMLTMSVHTVNSISTAFVLTRRNFAYAKIVEEIIIKIRNSATALLAYLSRFISLVPKTNTVCRATVACRCCLLGSYS